MSPAVRRLRWLVVPAILALAAVLRIWALGRPDTLVFDEIYYVRDAVSQLAHGYPTIWPDDDPAFDAERAGSHGDEPNSIAHPPLGKWMIALGLLLLGPDTGWGWRLSTALAGVATVAITMRIGSLLCRGPWVAWLAGLLLAVDGVHVVMSRVALLDGLLAMLIALGALFVAHDWVATARPAGVRVRWRRPWLLAAGLAFGAASAVKWSGLYPLAAFLVLLTIGDLLRRCYEDRPGPGRRRPFMGALLQALATAAIALPAAFAAYLASWIGWIIRPGGQNRHEGEPWWVSLWQWHLDAFSWHSTLTAPHPFQAHPLGWPLGLRPTAMYDARWDGYVAVITPLPNPLVAWGGVAAVGLLAWIVLRASKLALVRRGAGPLLDGAVAASAFVLIGYLSGWLPWVLTFSRSAVFQFYAVVLTPFSALALALVLAGFASLPGARGLPLRAGIRLDGSAAALQGRRVALGILLVAAIVLALLFWPLWIGMPVEHWFYRLHLWLPGWS